MCAPNPKDTAMRSQNLRGLIYFVLLFCTALSNYVDDIRVNRKELTPDSTKQEHTSRKISPIEARSLSDWRLENIILVSDIDGNLHGVDRKVGTSLWTLPIDEPLVKVLRETIGGEPSEHSNVCWIVEPTQGGRLYYFSPEFGLNRLPTTIKNLVMESPFALSGDNKIYTGFRKTSLYLIDIGTGEVKSQFGRQEDEQCPVPNVYWTPKYENSRRGDNTIMLGKSTYELSIYSKIDPCVVWNLTFLQWGPNNIDTDLIMQNSQLQDDLYFTPFFDKSLLAINKALGTPSWIGRFQSLPVDVFEVYGNKNAEMLVLPHSSKLLSKLQTSELESKRNCCFINKTASGRDWLAMSYENYPVLVKLAPLSAYQLAVSKYNLGYFDQLDIDHLRSIDVIDELTEPYLSGVHEIFDLNSSNSYQPVTRFHPMKHIGDGRDLDSSGLVVRGDGTTHIPSLISGIFFGDKDKNKDLATVDENLSKELNSNPAGFRNNLPVKYYETYNVFEDVHRHEAVSILRRVAEDLLVTSILIIALLGFLKINQWVKTYNSRQNWSEKMTLPPVEHKKIQLPEEVNMTEKPLPLVPENEDVVAQDEFELKPLIEDESKPSKKVGIVSPDEGESDTVGHSEYENDTLSTTTKKKRKRGSRGKNRGSKSKKHTGQEDADESASVEDDINDEELVVTLSLLKLLANVPQKKKLQISNSLIISDKILGYGSHGTVVFEGTFENRPVAVKRMLDNFYHLAGHEVRLLQESDDHPNVIRYFCSQLSETENFLYIALELCVCSLEDIVEKLALYPESLRLSHKSYNDALLQLVKGLHYLHSLKIVHRDLKPQNILVGETSGSKRQFDEQSIRLLISDFGLCEKLDANKSSFRATTNHAASGTMGWRAPELLLLHDLQEISPLDFSSDQSKHTLLNEGDITENGAVKGKRLTKAIDIFSLGCVFYYILSGGGHPFGDRYLREGNIMRAKYDLSQMKEFCPDDYIEAVDLIELMISFDSNDRPDTATIMKHPYFWTAKKKLEFLLIVSDRYENVRRDPPVELYLKLEAIGPKIHSNDWHARFDDDFINNLGKYRKYQTTAIVDLLSSFRNKYHHYNDMSPELQVQMSPVPHGFYQYFRRKFPNLLMEVYDFIKKTLPEEELFREFL